jgi:hypothetical protein
MVLFLIFLPFFGLLALGDVMGMKTLFRLFFVERRALERLVAFFRIVGSRRRHGHEDALPPVLRRASRTRTIGNASVIRAMIQVVGRSWRCGGSAFSHPATARLACSIASWVRCALSSKRHTTLSDLAAA